MNHYSSRRGQLFSALLEKNLQGAKSYDRIAGYFSSSILEIAGEAIEKMEGKVRIICNSELDIEDVKTAKLASEAVRREWCDFKPEELPPNGVRFKRLYEFIKAGKLEVRILPKEKFGLEHGKAGVFTLANGHRTSFLGSVNESYNGWKINYELVWEDDSPETVQWVQDEFDALWNDPCTVSLSDYVIADIKRIGERTVIKTVEEWKDGEEDPASVTVESPVNRNGFGLWEHQKYFVDHVFRDHKKEYGARYVLADDVGLGKTAQLAICAELMALHGSNPILVIVPKTLLAQWQNELRDLLGIPTAVWNGKQWVDEEGVIYPLPITKAPRRIGIVSQGIINNGSESCMKLKEELLSRSYECVIVDEAHRARRKNLSERKLHQSPDKNNLYEFLMQLSKKTHSMLLATATPVQLYKVEAYDLLNILAQRNNSVLGSINSYWRKPPEKVLDSLSLITGEKTVDDINEAWLWMSNPMPPAEEEPRTFGRLRADTQMEETDFICRTLFSGFQPNNQRRIKNALQDGFFQNHNPYIRHIVRRTRSYLENTMNPETNQPYLPKVEVELLGEKKSDAVLLDGYLGEAYRLAEAFCEKIKERCPAAGLFKTLLLRRIGSSMIAGFNTGSKMLKEWIFSEEEIDDDIEEADVALSDDIKNLTAEEHEILTRFVSYLEKATIDKTTDPKYQRCLQILTSGVIMGNGQHSAPWKNSGCIIFSQFYDTAEWVAKNLSEDIAEPVGVYAGGSKSGIFIRGEWESCSRDEIKSLVKNRKIKVLVGTDAASEGLNLQTLGTLINFDLPWNPTRLEQRKGRIQRIGQMNDVVYVYNMRYRGSVEDRVHELLSERLKSIYEMFGQLPDVLEDVWIDVAVGDIEKAKERINKMPKEHPFKMKYHDNVSAVDWESCAKVLNRNDIRKALMEQW